jgi:prophage antirepressor-like protein
MKTEIWLGHEIRFVEKEPGDWWAVLADIADALGLQAKRINERLPKGVVSNDILSTPGGAQEMLIVNEEGIYEVIWASRKKEAKQFRHWVYSMLRELRRASGLEGFQVFRMLDKEHQKEAMSRLCGALHHPVRVDFIKCNCIADKAVSSLHGEAKMLHKRDMTPKMLTERQPILDEIVELMAVVDKYSLPVSVSEAIYGKHAKGEKKC